MSGRSYHKKKSSLDTILSKIKAITPVPFQPDQIQEIKTHLEEEGWAAVTVLTPQSASEKQDKFWNFIEDIGGGVDREHATTWGKEMWPDQIHGILKSYGIGQADFMWELRTDPNVLKVFSSLWECEPEDLLTSFDGACMYPIGPKEGPNPFAKDETTLWPHRDQNPAKKDLMCVQGSVSLVDNTGAHDGGLLVWPRTHKKDWTKVDPMSDNCRGEWYRIKADLIDTLDARVIRVPAGTLLLWDSRTVHANRPPSKEGKTRSVAFVCMLDGRRADPSVLERRRLCRRQGNTTSHWPFPLSVNSDTKSFQGSNNGELRTVLDRKIDAGVFNDENDSQMMKSLTCGYLSKE